MKYFETLYKVSPQYVELDAPISLEETAIIKDTVDSKILLRNKFANVGNQDIVAVAVRISLSDVFGEKILSDGNDSYEYVYQDLSVAPGEIVGNKVAIELPESARKAEVKIEKAVCGDGSVWKTNPDNIVSVQPQREIEGTDEFINGLDDNEIPPLFYYAINNDSWQCTCGQVNKLIDCNCRYCGRTYSHVSQDLNRDAVTEKYTEYLHKIHAEEKTRETEEEDRPVIQTKHDVRTEEEHIIEGTAKAGGKGKTKKYKLIGIIAAIAVAILVVCIMVRASKPSEPELSFAVIVEKQEDDNDFTYTIIAMNSGETDCDDLSWDVTVYRKGNKIISYSYEPETVEGNGGTAEHGFYTELVIDTYEITWNSTYSSGSMYGQIFRI